MKQSTKELGRVLPDRIRLLASLIARKPAQYTPEWAKTIDEAFSLYTRTSTINLFHQTNRLLIDLDWPFPAFIDLTEEQTRSARHGSLQSLTGRMVQASEVREIGITMTALIACLGGTNGSRFFDAAMVDLFDQHCDRVFGFLQNSPILQTKSQIVSDIKAAYRGRLWAATITAIVPLLDHIVREYFGARRLNVTIQVLRDAFMREAGLRPKDVMPGSAVWDGQKDPASGNTFAKSLEEDLRLPGVFLSSFFEFADRYYEWYKTTEAAPRTPLNRHAIMHCAAEYWTQPNAVRMLVFTDLTLRLERVLRILLSGVDPGATPVTEPQ